MNNELLLLMKLHSPEMIFYDFASWVHSHIHSHIIIFWMWSDVICFSLVCLVANNKNINGSNSSDQIRTSLLSDDKLKSIMSFLDEVEKVEEDVRSEVMRVRISNCLQINNSNVQGGP